MSVYSFRPMTRDDQPLLPRWLKTPEVDRWWRDPDAARGGEDDAAPFDAELFDPNLALWIVSLDRRPFAFLQDYDPHAWAGHHFAHLPRGARGIDQFIGAPEMIGRGHGAAFIRAHVDRLFSQGVPAVGTDPHPTNRRAIRACEKSGFLRGAERQTQWGSARLMLRYP